MANLVFTSLKFDRTSKNKKGASFSATLKQVKVTASGYVSMNAVEPMISQDEGKNSDAQLSRTANAGAAIGGVSRCGKLQGSLYGFL